MVVGNTVQEIFGSLPDEAELQALPEEMTPLKTNAHVHLPPNFGSILSIEDAISSAKAEDLAVLGTANYYDYNIYTPFAHAAVEAGITPVFGIEILTMDEGLQKAGIRVNDPKNPGKIYLCGRGLTRFDAIPEQHRAIWTRIREGDKQRITEMIARLNKVEMLKKHGILLEYQTIARNIAEAKGVPAETVFLQERHLAQALQQAIFARLSGNQRQTFLQQLYQSETPPEIENLVSVQNELRNALLKQGKTAYVEECFVTPQEAAALIRGLGGYVSYPTLIDGAPQILPGEGTPQELVDTLLRQQFGAAEFIPTRNDREVLRTYARTLRQQGIALGAGTEHNTPAKGPFLPHCIHDVPLDKELLTIFWEGACVAVAHQYLYAKGQKGFQFFSDRQERDAQIKRMATLGSKVVTAFRGK